MIVNFFLTTMRLNTCYTGKQSGLYNNREWKGERGNLQLLTVVTPPYLSSCSNGSNHQRPLGFRRNTWLTIYTI